MKKKISFLLASIMILALVLGAIPFSVSAAAENVSVLKTSDSSVLQSNLSFADALAYANNATEDVTVKLNSDVTLAAWNYTNSAATVTIDGSNGTDRYTITTSGSAHHITSTSDATARNLKIVNVKFNHATKKRMIEYKSPGTLTLENVYAYTGVKQEYAMINAANLDSGTAVLTVNIENSQLIMANEGGRPSNWGAAIIRGGNPGRSSSAVINVIGSTLDATAAANHYAFYLPINNTVNVKNSTIKVGIAAPFFKQGGESVVVNTNTGEWTGNTITSIGNLFPESVTAGIEGTTQTKETAGKIYTGDAETDTWTEGESYTDWDSMITAANAALANGDVKVVLSATTKLAYKNDNGKVIGSGDGNKLIVDGQNNTMWIYLTHHAFNPMGYVEFKNITINSYTTNSLFRNNASGLAADDELVLTDVNLNIGHTTQYYVIGWFEESTQGTAEKPHKLTLDGVTVRKAEAGSLNDIPIADFDYRGSKFVDVSFIDCDIDFTGTTGYGLHIDEALKDANDASKGRVNNIHLVVENSIIKAAGKYDAIRGALSVITYNIDAESVLQSNGVACNTDLTRDETVAPPPPAADTTATTTTAAPTTTTAPAATTTTAPTANTTAPTGTTVPEGTTETLEGEETTPSDEGTTAIPDEDVTTAAPDTTTAAPDVTTEAPADVEEGGCAGCGEGDGATAAIALAIAMAAAVAIVVKKK